MASCPPQTLKKLEVGVEDNNQENQVSETIAPMQANRRDVGLEGIVNFDPRDIR